MSAERLVAGVDALIAWRDPPYTDDLTSWRDACEALDNARLPEVAAALRRLAKIERACGRNDHWFGHAEDAAQEGGGDAD